MVVVVVVGGGGGGGVVGVVVAAVVVVYIYPLFSGPAAPYLFTSVCVHEVVVNATTVARTLAPTASGPPTATPSHRLAQLLRQQYRRRNVAGRH